MSVTLLSCQLGRHALRCARVLNDDERACAAHCAGSGQQPGVSLDHSVWLGQAFPEHSAAAPHAPFQYGPQSANMHAPVGATQPNGTGLQQAPSLPFQSGSLPLDAPWPPLSPRRASGCMSGGPAMPGYGLPSNQAMMHTADVASTPHIASMAVQNGAFPGPVSQHHPHAQQVDNLPPMATHNGYLGLTNQFDKPSSMPAATRGQPGMPTLIGFNMPQHNTAAPSNSMHTYVRGDLASTSHMQHVAPPGAIGMYAPNVPDTQPADSSAVPRSNGLYGEVARKVSSMHASRFGASVPMQVSGAQNLVAAGYAQNRMQPADMPPISSAGAAHTHFGGQQYAGSAQPPARTQSPDHHGPPGTNDLQGDDGDDDDGALLADDDVWHENAEHGEDEDDAEDADQDGDRVATHDSGEHTLPKQEARFSRALQPVLVFRLALHLFCLRDAPNSNAHQSSVQTSQATAPIAASTTKQTGKGGRRRRAAPARKVTMQRKQNNRDAQARYRERRKARGAELHARVAELISELDLLKLVPEQAAALEAENARLRAAVDWREQHPGAGQARVLVACKSACCAAPQSV